MLPVLLRIFALIGVMSVFLTIVAGTWALAYHLNPRFSYITHLITALFWPLTLPTLLIMLMCEKILSIDDTNY